MKLFDKKSKRHSYQLQTIEEAATSTPKESNSPIDNKSKKPCPWGSDIPMTNHRNSFNEAHPKDKHLVQQPKRHSSSF